MSNFSEISLRPLAPDDCQRILQWRNSPDVAPYMYTDHVIGEAEHLRWFETIRQDPRRIYWIIEVQSLPVGLANIYDIVLHDQRCSWAYYLADPSLRGKGIGGYVEFMVIDKVFNELGMTKLWCEVISTNERVWKLHQSFGFEIEAQLRQHVYKNGKPIDVIGLGLLKSDWLEKRDAILARLAKISERAKRPTS